MADFKKFCGNCKFSEPHESQGMFYCSKLYDCQEGNIEVNATDYCRMFYKKK